jgi:guanine deaminase
MQWHRGVLVHLSGSPDLAGAPAALCYQQDGGLLVADDGTIAWSGPWSERPAVDAPLTDHHGGFLLPGFVDTHLHYPQVRSVDAFGGGRLLDWLDRVIFPAEARFADESYARSAAAEFCDRLVAAGTTTSMVFGSQFPAAQDALFEQARSRGLRMVLGRTAMTVGPSSAAALLTSEPEAISLAREEIDRWHPADVTDRSDSLVQVAIVPRFALSVTPTTLAALGELYDEMRGRGVYLTTHVSENASPDGGEVAAVRAAFGVERYLDVYDGLFLPGSGRGGSSLLGRRSVLAHAVHCSDDEFRRLAECRTSVAHCPVSQMFLGSGTMPWIRPRQAGVNVAVGTDIAAGDEWLIPRVLNAAFKVHADEPGDGAVTLHPAELLFAGTLAGARALDLEDRIGNLDPGKDADFVVVDPGGCPDLAAAIEERAGHGDPAGDGEALLFTLLMSVREPAIAAAYVRGRRLE